MKLFKKKKKKNVTLFLEKDGESKTVEVNLGSTWNMIKRVKTLTGFLRKGWKLVKTEGDPKSVAMFQSVIDGNKPTLKEMQDFANLPKIPEKVKKFFGKYGEQETVEETRKDN